LASGIDAHRCYTHLLPRCGRHYQRNDHRDFNGDRRVLQLHFLELHRNVDGKRDEQHHRVWHHHKLDTLRPSGWLSWLR
jgi:hypothetical protein